MGVESINNNTHPILNSLNDSTSNEMSRPSNCIKWHKTNVRYHAIIVDIIIYIHTRLFLLIIRLAGAMTIVKIFFIVFTTYSLLERFLVSFPYTLAAML